MDSSGLPASTNLLSYPGAFSGRYHFADINLHHDALHLVQRALRAFFTLLTESAILGRNPSPDLVG